MSIVIIGAARTAIGAFGGGLSSVSAAELGAVAITAALQRANITPDNVDDVILGQVLTAGVGQNAARQAAVAAGIPHQRTAMTINQVCGSGLRAVMLAAQAIAHGDSNVVVAGGQENMSLSAHCAMLRNGVRMGDGTLVDTMIKDGLWDVFNNYHMGITAENVATQWNITREAQDAFALASQHKAEAAQKAGKFHQEIAPVTIKGKKGDTVIDTDEHPRHGATLESLSKLRPAFSKDGTVTAGNASGINDGAAALVVTSEAHAKVLGAQPLVRLTAWATTGVDPAVMGSGPISASRAALAKAGWTVDSLDVIEANEAFAAQACAVNNDLGWDTARVNVNGGAIALGHPIGASGARVLVTLIHELRRRNGKRGLATLCIGGGMGVAVCIENLG